MAAVRGEEEVAAGTDSPKGIAGIGGYTSEAAGLWRAWMEARRRRSVGWDVGFDTPFFS